MFECLDVFECSDVFECLDLLRLSLPAAWRGVRDSELEKVSGVKGAIFVHASGIHIIFIQKLNIF